MSVQAPSDMGCGSRCYWGDSFSTTWSHYNSTQVGIGLQGFHSLQHGQRGVSSCIRVGELNSNVSWDKLQSATSGFWGLNMEHRECAVFAALCLVSVRRVKRGVNWKQHPCCALLHSKRRGGTAALIITGRRELYTVVLWSHKRISDFTRVSHNASFAEMCIKVFLDSSD